MSQFDTVAIPTYEAIVGSFLRIGFDDPTVVPTYGAKGALYIQTTLIGVPALFQKQDSGISVNWLLVGGGGGGITTVGPIDSVAKSANGATIVGANIVFQTADGGFPGMLNLAAQNIVGDKSFSQPIQCFNQAVVPYPGVAGGAGAIYAVPSIPMVPLSDALWVTQDASGNVRYINSIIKQAGVPVVTAPDAINFIGATVTPNGLGVDVTVAAALAPKRDKFVIAAPDIVNGYLDLSNTAQDDSVIVSLEGTASPLFEGVGNDYQLSVVGPITRITFDPAIVATWLVGQKVAVNYWY